MMKEKKLYLENLDGLRFICFLMVFFFHSFYTGIPEIKESPIYTFIKKDLFGNGNLGVNFFFVLSGFLITYLLITEKRRFKKISIPYFWIRRILRIWPLYYFCVFFGFCIFPLIKTALGQSPNETAHLLNYLTFTNNFDLIKNGLPDASVLGVLWSVAIEEQFYLLWPIVLSLFSIKYYWIPFLLIITTSLLFSYYNNTELMLEHHSLSCMGDLTIGAFGAWLYLTSTKFSKFIQDLPRWAIWGIYIFFILIFFFRDEFLFANPAIKGFDRSFIAIVILLIILEQCFSQRSWYKMSKFKRLSKLGTITYGLYCLHFIGILVAINITKFFGLNNELWQVLVLETILAICLTILFAQLSYKYFESFFLRLKDKFSVLNK